jgi:dephospho-CoA kinase
VVARAPVNSGGPAAAHARPPTLGLTGPPGAGKSTVARELAALGCVVSDSDALAHAAYDDPPLRSAVQALFGTVDRRAIAGRVFSDPDARARLESLIHPWIAARRAAAFAAAPAGTRALVIDAPLLLEAGLGASCDRILFVDAPLGVRQARVAAARGWTPAELARREAAQMPLDQKRALAHHVIRNDGDPASLRAQVRAVLDEVSPVRGDPGSPDPAR